MCDEIHDIMKRDKEKIIHIVKIVIKNYCLTRFIGEEEEEFK